MTDKQTNGKEATDDRVVWQCAASKSTMKHLPAM